MCLSATALAAQDRPAAPGKGSPRPQTAKNPSTQVPVEKTLEAFLRKIYAWGPSFHLKIGPFKDAPVPGFFEVNVEVTMGGQSDSTVVYVSKDGRYLLRGDMQDMTADPTAPVRARIRLTNNPSRGPADAAVTVVEYSDFQCPSCRQLHQALKAIVPSYPQVRFVFKDFPLTQIHPWAMTAAIAGRCAYQQKPEAFWKLHDTIFDNQEVISAENVWQKMLDFAAPVDLDVEAFRSCMASPEASQAIQENVKEAQALKVANTPTVFVNGRRMIGGDRGLLEQYMQYELQSQAHPQPAKPQA